MRRVTGYKDYTTREGDTFDALALEMYGEEMLAHYIAEFNPDYADVLIFDANVASGCRSSKVQRRRKLCRRGVGTLRTRTTAREPLLQRGGYIRGRVGELLRARNVRRKASRHPRDPLQ